MEKTSAIGSVGGDYVDYVPGVQPGTLLVAADRNAIQGEIINAISDGGQTPSGADLHQLRKSMPLYNFRNKIINGNWEFNQRYGPGHTASIAGTESIQDDRWLYAVYGTSASAQFTSALFTAGERSTAGIPGLSKRHLHVNVTNGGDASAAAIRVMQRIEDVDTLSGRPAMLSFWARSTVAGKSLAFSYAQVFGSGGSGTEQIHIAKVAITTSWAYYKIPVTFASISGKTIGTDSFLELSIWLSSGSGTAGLSNSLGVQSGDFYISDIQLEEGYSATPYEQLPYDLRLALCQRFYEKSWMADEPPGSAFPTVDADSVRYCGTTIMSQTLYQRVYFKTKKRKISGTVTLYDPTSFTSGNILATQLAGSGTIAAYTDDVTTDSFLMWSNGAWAAWEAIEVRFHWTADAEF